MTDVRNLVEGGREGNGETVRHPLLLEFPISDDKNVVITIRVLATEK